MTVFTHLKTLLFSRKSFVSCTRWSSSTESFEFETNYTTYWRTGEVVDYNGAKSFGRRRGNAIEIRPSKSELTASEIGISAFVYARIERKNGCTALYMRNFVQKKTI